MKRYLEESELRRHVELRAPDYFPELSGRNVTVELAKASRRRFSETYHYSVRGGGVDRQVFAKVPIEAAAHIHASSENTPSPDDRPRLVPVLSVLEEVELEHAGLTRMQEHFAQKHDSRFRAPRVLDLLRQSAILVEGIPFPTLSQRLQKHLAATRRGAVGDALREAFYNTGAWLRLFHGIPSGPGTRSRLANREAILDTVSLYLSYLDRHPSSSRGLDAIRQTIEDQFHLGIPSTFPLVCGHGDFGLHNVFVADDVSVIGFDTLACWQTSPYEDICYFLLLLETIPPLFLNRSWTMPARTIEVARDAFLEGYFGHQAVPSRTILLFDVLISLDKWASAVHSCRRAGGMRGGVKRGRLKLQQHWLSSRIERALRRLDSGPLLTCASQATSKGSNDATPHNDD